MDWRKCGLVTFLVVCGIIYIILGLFRNKWIPYYAEFQRFPLITPDISTLLQKVDCEKIFDGDDAATRNARQRVNWINNENLRDEKKRFLSDDRVSSLITNCTEYKQKREYILQSMSEEERKYPIAYIISIYRGLYSFENLLRLIYHPQNIYCVHIDQKSDREFQRKVEEIVDCFDNVFLASTMTKVFYTHWTIVQSSLNCLTDLIERWKDHHWKYVFNLCGLDLPTKTNLEIVRALKNLNGTNSVASANFNGREHKKRRYELRYRLPYRSLGDILRGKTIDSHSWLRSTGKEKMPPPHGIKMFSGTDYFIWTREAVEFFMRDSNINDFFEWNKNTLVPDEHVWATIQRMYPQVPGSFPQSPDFRTTENDVITRTRTWGGDKYKCKTKYVRAICIYGIDDLEWLVHQKGMFANKLDPQIDLVAVECLSEWMRNRTISGN